MSERARASRLTYPLAALCAGAIAAAILVVGPASGNPAGQTRTASAARGVVQSTVSGSGNIQAASQLNLGFKTSGTVAHIYVTQGERVTQGQLLATLDPQSAEVTLEQAKANAQAAEATLAKDEETNGEASTGQSSGGSGGASTTATTAMAASHASIASVGQTTTTPNNTSPSSSTPSTPPAASAPTRTTTTSAPAASSPSKTTTAAPAQATKASQTASPSSGSTAGGGGSSSTSSSSISTATREANLASARAAVKSAKLAVRSDEQAVANTKLVAPESGTIVSLSGQVGETVSGGGTTKASGTGAGSASSGESGSGSAAGGASSSARSSSASAGSAASSSSSFAVLSDLSSMQLVVPLNESEVGSVRAGQTATVTIEALGGRKVAAHVSGVAILSTSNSGVVSYDVTFQLDQMESGLKPGMSATAEVVVKQAEGVNVPTSAISGGAVTVVRGGKDVRQAVVTGLAGNSATLILGGLKAGEVVILPSPMSTTGAAGSRLGTGRGLGGGGLGGAGLGGGGGFPAGPLLKGGG